MEPPKEHQHTPEKSSSEAPSSISSAFPPSGFCAKCGGPTISEPSPLAALPDMSPPPNYRPIRAPAINLPHNSQAIILSPVPHAEQVPVVSPPYQFECPVKRIHSPDDIRRFQESASFKNFLGFVVSLSESIRGHKISDPCHTSSTVSAIVSILETLLHWIDEIPPAQQSARYGNVSFRSWHERLGERGESLILEFLPDEFKGSTIEIIPYFFDSFGNSSRIDYGTGHETNFAAWLYCLARMGIIKEEDYHGVVARVFVKYLELMRKLQMVYCLEPAGSHGVWGLDDYHFLPFIFGSSQLIDHKYMKPKSIHNDDILENFSSEYIFLSCIAFVKKVKKGLFAEHSPLLDDISGVPNWKKVNSGLLKMYKVEVLEKVPIMQHFLFGWLIKWYLYMEEDCEFRHWDELIPDALGLIFSHLSLQEILTVVPRVCKAWNRAVTGPYCWQEIDIEVWSSHCHQSDQLDRMLEMLITRSSGSLRKLSVTGLRNDSIFSFIAQHAGSLQTLKVPKSGLTNSGVINVADKLSSLTFLDLSFCCKVGPEAIQVIGKHCKSLRELRRNMHPLDVTDVVSHDDEAYAIANTMPKLKRLEIQYQRVSTEGVLKLLSCCIFLEFLELRGCWDVQLDYKFFKDKFPDLKVLGPSMMGFYDMINDWGECYSDYFSDGSDYVVAWEFLEDGVMGEFFEDEFEHGWDDHFNTENAIIDMEPHIWPPSP